ncbi:MAG: hypothetical protein KBT02_05315 [Treponema sp.]|nr:hypothetical protein [Candidatus Treponema caballi]
MKKLHILFLVLLAFSALVLTSCGGLASPKHETGSFSFRVTDEMISAISRAAVSDSTTCTITLHLYSTDGTSYDSTQTKTDSLAALKNYTFDPFTGIPLGMEMNLTVEVKVGGKLVYASDKQKFTLEKSNANLALTVQMKRIIDMPIVLVDKSVGDTPDYYRLTEISQTDGYLTLPGREVDALSYGAFYCTDNAGTLYIANLNKMNAIPLEGETVKCTFNMEDFDNSIIQGLSYDASRDKVVTILLDNVTEEVYCYQFTPGTLPVELTLTPTTPGVLKLEKNPYYDNMGDEKPPVIYPFNGRLYSLLTSDSSAAASVKLRVQSLTDGSWIKDATVTIPQVNNQTENKEYTFNDLYVDESGIYVLFHQYEMWHEPPAYPYNDYALTEMNAGDNGFIDRGGIIVADYETLAQKKAFGMPAINTSLTVPLITDVYAEGQYYYPKLFADAAHTKEKTVTIPVTYSVANEGKGELANPQKIVGILPKKLIIADGGTFLYTNELDFTVETGNKAGVYALDRKDKITSNTATRLVEIDLETFSAKVVASIDDYNFYESTLNSGFRVEYEQQIPQGNTSYYGYETQFVANCYDVTSGVKYLDNTSCQYNNGSYHAIANIVFGEAGV